MPTGLNYGFQSRGNRTQLPEGGSLPSFYPDGRGRGTRGEFLSQGVDRVRCEVGLAMRCPGNRPVEWRRIGLFGELEAHGERAKGWWGSVRLIDDRNHQLVDGFIGESR